MEYEGEMRWDHEAVLARFEEEVRGDIARKKGEQATVPYLHTPSLHTGCKCARSSSGDGKESGSSSSDSEGEGESDDSDDAGKKEQRDKRRKASIRKRNKRRKTKQSEAAIALVKQEVDWRRHHPASLSSEIVFNVPDMLNESPACRCSSDRKGEGMRHNHYLGEKKEESTVESCSASSLHHYFLSVHPSPSKQLRRTNEMKIEGGDGSFHFEGFSLLSHRPLSSTIPQEPQHKWTDEYRFALEEDEKLTEQTIGSVRALDSLFSYITEDILQLFDLRRWPEEVESERRSRWSHGLRGSREEEERADGCPIFHVLPRFVRRRQDGSSELAPISAVLEFIREKYARPFCTKEESWRMHSDARVFDAFADLEKEGLVIDATRRPSSLRVDSLDRSEYLKGDRGEGDGLPVITHHTWRPTPFLLAARPDYQEAAAKLTEMRAQVREMGEEKENRMSPQEEKQLRGMIANADNRLQKLKNECMARRETPISFSSKHFRRTGFKADLGQHTILLVMMMNHVRFHWALEKLEERIAYKFEDRTLIELALSHPSYNANYGTNPDHARNALNLCGVRQTGQKYRQHLDGPRVTNEILELKRGRNRKKGLDRLVELMESMPKAAKKLQINPGTINERLEFLGDSVVEMIVTVHLFFLLPDHDEGALATFRSALVQNKNLAALAQEIYLDKLMLMSHGVELLHEPEYRHATANSFEAFMAAVYLDSGKNMDHCERIYGDAMFGREPEMLKIWTELSDHELKCEIPGSDRSLIPVTPALQKLVEFENSIGLKFAHIRVLARAFTRSSGAVNNLTKGDHQSLELLGDTILQMATTDFLYRRFPLLHEGHLSLLRTCLVSNKTQSVICDDLDMSKYVVDFSHRRNHNKVLKMKDKADLVESLLGAIYVDRGWEYCRVFTRVCFFPRMKFFIDSHAWADPKSALQQLCLALPRAPSGERGHRLMPEYRIVAEHGPTNTREYRVACVFRGKKISEGMANTVHNAQMKAAQEGMQNLPKFFPEEWARHEKKLLRQRSLRDPIRMGGGRERMAQGSYEVDINLLYVQMPYPTGAQSSSSSHLPPSLFPPHPSHPSSFSYPSPPFTSRLIPQYRGLVPPPVPSLYLSSSTSPPPPPSSRPMDLMSLSLDPPPALLHKSQQPQPAVVDRLPASDAALPDAPPTPSFSAAVAASTSRPSTPLPPPPPPPRGCPLRALPPPPQDETPPPPPPSRPHSEWLPLRPRSSLPPSHNPHRNPHQRPSFAPSVGPRSAPYPASNGTHRGWYQNGTPRPLAPTPPQIPNQTPKPRSLLDISPFGDLWGK
ncbi:hypothetical protein PENTCL1PPCAC_23298 [Pristionchus entomophagus]|uniref:Uncharacterized protein n=1 Tax=Pristionchus entomophagus TaxID=358040 RepID=A0AAV5U3X3_9BILA|nr:hypothetical protein PENTCL1PPCAC_23298 [Pristionchus entomophagus]